MVDEQGSEERCLEGSGCKAQRDVVVAVQIMVSLEMMIMITRIKNDKRKEKQGAESCCGCFDGVGDQDDVERSPH